MSDEYTPGTNRVRDAYVRGMRLAFLSVSAGEYADEFDRWLAERDARIRAEVIDWIEGLDGHGFLNRLLANDAREHFGLTKGADRGWVAYMTTEDGLWGGVSEEEALAQWGRWLVARDHEVAAKALRDAADEAQQGFVDEQQGIGFARVRTDWLRARADRIEKGAGDVR